MKNNTNTPKIRMVLLIRVGKFIRLKWVNAHADISSWVRGLKFHPSPCLSTYLVYASSEGSVDSRQICPELTEPSLLDNVIRPNEKIPVFRVTRPT